MTPPLRILSLHGADIQPYIKEIARLRINIFREFPYLYDGSEEYERDYLKTYTKSNESIAVLVLDENKPVGVSTGLPMEDEEEDFNRPFLDEGYDPATVFYCGESILKKKYRGRGIYRRFFEMRESHAKGLGGFKTICFCSVQRPADHALRPAHYQSLGPIWKKYGYEKHPELTTEFAWKDIDEKSETDKTMVFWMKNF